MRQRDYPRDVVVRDMEWEIRFVRRIPSSLTDDPTVIGMTDEADSVIYIKQGLSAEERLVTFWHELLHVIEFEWDIDLPHALVYKLEVPMARLWFENAWTLGA